MTWGRDDKIGALHSMGRLEGGGAEMVLVNFLNNLSDRFTPLVCCLMRRGPLAEKITNPRAELIELGKGMEGNDYKVPFRLARLLKEKKVDVVQSHDWGTLLETA